MKAQKRSDFDWVAHWFTLGEQTGERSEIIFGRVSEKQTELFRLHHAKYDGITGLLHLLRERGELHQDFLPRLPVRRRPSRWVQFREALKIFLKGPVKSRTWATRNPDWKPGESSTETVAFSWHVMTAEQTSAALAQAKALGVSLNSLLFRALDDAVGPHLDDSRRPTVWIMPVSIHPRISVDTMPRNLASYVDLHIPREATALDIEREVRRLERNQAFWGLWQVLHIGRWFGEWIVKLIVKSNPRTQQKTGIFSNLGNWSGPSQAANDATTWFFMPPMMAFQPFAASALTWNGRLTLAVRLHPALSTDKSYSQKLVDDWSRSLQRLSGESLVEADSAALG